MRIVTGASSSFWIDWTPASGYGSGTAQMVSTQSELAQGGNGEILTSPKRADLHWFSIFFHAKWEGSPLICHDCPIKIGILMFYCQADTKRAVPSDRNMRPATLLFELGIFSHSKLGWVRIGIFRRLEPAWARHFMGDGTAPWSMWMTHGAGNHWILGHCTGGHFREYAKAGCPVSKPFSATSRVDITVPGRHRFCATSMKHLRNNQTPQPFGPSNLMKITLYGQLEQDHESHGSRIERLF